MTNEDRSGAPSWADPTNVETTNDVRAVVSMPAGAYSDWLRCLFDFSSDVPADAASIDGVEVSFERAATATNSVTDSAVYLRDSSGQIGDNKATATYYLSYTDAYESHGGAADLWGANPSVAAVRDGSTWGVEISCVNTHGTQARSALIDHVMMRVTYTEAGAGGAVVPIMLQHGQLDGGAVL